MIISEFRLRGPNGANDEFIEIYNNSNNAVNVQANDGSAGYAVAASHGVTRFVIPNGTIIPARGHFLGVNNLSYSLANRLDAGGTSLTVGLVDPGVSAGTAPNYVRNMASDPINNSTFGTIDVRRRLTNTTGAPISRLRFRIIEFTTFPAASGAADLRARSSGSVVVSLSGGGTTTVRGTTLEQPPTQPNGGGFNSSMSVSLASPLKAGASIDLRFLFGVQQQGKFGFCAVLRKHGPGIGQGRRQRAKAVTSTQNRAR